MRPLATILPSFLISLTLFISGCSGGTVDPAATEIQRRLAEERELTRHTLDTLTSRDLLRTFYERRGYSPAWSDARSISATAESLRALLGMADAEGLTQQDYHLSALGDLIGKIPSAERENEESAASLRAELDLLLSDAFVLYACHLCEGKVDRHSYGPRRVEDRNGERYIALLEKALSEHDIGKNLRGIAPSHLYYRGLRTLLASFRLQEKSNRWTRVPAGSPLMPGERGRRVFALRSRLLELGDLHPRIGSINDEFDSTLADAVRIFQKRHGLETTGCVDSATFASLNVPPSKRVEQILVTMERWRWLPRELGAAYVLVNIPDFMLTAVEHNRVVISMKVVLGLPTWQTPVFSSAIEEVLFNSPWLAPEDIVEKELINYMKADTNYLPSNSMSLWRKAGDSLVMIDPRTINWPEMAPEKIDFYLRQEGGPQNIMGQVKFLTPNNSNVYLHDTPYRDDFAKRVRMFSHGCIRLEKPFDFAEHVLRQYPEWTMAKIDTVIARRTEHAVRLKMPLPVHIVYATVWREQDGSVQFRQDCYRLDQKLAAALGPTASPRRTSTDAPLSKH